MDIETFSAQLIRSPDGFIGGFYIAGYFGRKELVSKLAERSLYLDNITFFASYFVLLEM